MYFIWGNSDVVFRKIKIAQYLAILVCRIRHADRNDYDEIVHMNLEEYDYVDTELALETIFHEVQWWGSRELLEWHHKILRETEGDILVVTAADEIVGELDYAIERSGPEPYIHIIWLLIQKNHRKKGLAHKLLIVLQKIANELHIAKIQVEPEDERSRQLYAKYGTLDKKYSNWKLYFELGAENVQSAGVVESFETISINDFAQWQRVVGQYYSPTFDLLQMLQSNGTKVENYIWGDTYPPVVVNYELNGHKYKVIMTQYLRIYAAEEVNLEDLYIILQDAIKFLKAHNYIGINIQIYHDERLEEVLESLEFEREFENLDDIFTLRLEDEK